MQTWDLHHANLEFTDFTMFERPNANMGPPHRTRIVSAGEALSYFFHIIFYIGL